MLRVDATNFPGNLHHLWEIEHVRYRETLRHIPPARNDRAALLDLGSSRPWLPYFSTSTMEFSSPYSLVSMVGLF